MITTPQSSGMSNSRFSPIAEPRTSARSQAAMAISQRRKRTVLIAGGIFVVAGLGEVAAGDQPQAGR